MCARSGLRRVQRAFGYVGATLALLALIGPLYAQATFSSCGDLKSGYGPYDYRTQKDKLRIVEPVHFTPQMEALIGGRTKAGSALGGSIDYTLRASPNHHRALNAMMRYGERLKLPKVPGAEYSVECYFDRAMRFAPDDPVVFTLYAIYLNRQGRRPEGERVLESLAARMSDNVAALENIGLLYLEWGDHQQALRQAHRLHALGSQTTELTSRLRKAGHWVDPLTAAPSASAPPGSTNAPPATTTPAATESRP